jgi:hypothetical protein
MLIGRDGSEVLSCSDWDTRGLSGSANDFSVIDRPEV